MEQKTIIFLGLQGSGKGTQVDLLEQSLKNASEIPVFRFATGSAFRRLIEEEGYTQDLVRETLNHGTLQPLFLSVSLWADALVRTLRGDEHLLIDGFPRATLEAQVLEGALVFYRRKQPTVISLTLSQDEALKRLLLRRRADDTAEAVTKRFAWYREYGVPVVEYYRSRTDYTLVEINADQPVEKVHADIMDALGLSSKKE